jgi:hypothetical protein
MQSPDSDTTRLIASERQAQLARDFRVAQPAPTVVETRRRRRAWRWPVWRVLRTPRPFPTP